MANSFGTTLGSRALTLGMVRLPTAVWLYAPGCHYTVAQAVLCMQPNGQHTLRAPAATLLNLLVTCCWVICRSPIEDHARQKGRLPLQVVLVAAICEFLGAVLLGASVTSTIKCVSQPQTNAFAAMSLLLQPQLIACNSLLFVWHFSQPTSCHFPNLDHQIVSM
jgi:phosphate/sulfate permease